QAYEVRKLMTCLWFHECMAQAPTAPLLPLNRASQVRVYPCPALLFRAQQSVMSCSALYPGSFDAVTFGHLDIIRRASRHYDLVTVAVAENPGKLQPLFSIPERVAMLQACVAEMPNVEVKSFPGLTVNFARSI